MELVPDDAPEPNQTNAIEEANKMTTKNQEDLTSCFNKNVEAFNKLKKLAENRQITLESRSKVKEFLIKAGHSYQDAFTLTNSTPPRIIESLKRIEIANGFISKANEILNNCHTQELAEKTENDLEESQHKGKKVSAIVPKPPSVNRAKL